jgi:hypothetical protein
MAEKIGGSGSKPSAQSVTDAKHETPQPPSTQNPNPSTTTPKK